VYDFSMIFLPQNQMLKINSIKRQLDSRRL
jgi:hypothetical protein